MSFLFSFFPLDLKHLLMEANQKLPPFLEALESEAMIEIPGADVGCSYCGGLGHRIINCPKLEQIQNKQANAVGKKDFLAAGTSNW